jgi:hypothetical protein
MSNLINKYQAFRARRRAEYEAFLAFGQTWNQLSQRQLKPVRQEI